MDPAVRTGPTALARNAALNAAGQLAPLLVALPVLPYTLRVLGTERFAVLTVAWTVIGYFGFLDLGLGRATTKHVAGALGANRADTIRRIVWSSLALQAVLGLAGGIAIAAAAPFIAGTILRIAEPLLLAETRATLVAIAAALPLVLLSGTMSGVLEAHQRFDLVNAVRVPANVATLAIPALGAAAGTSLPVMVGGILIVRAVALAVYGAFAVRVSGGLRPARPQWVLLRQLLAFGGWLTVSLLAVPILTYAERLLIGGLRSLTELAYYAVPFEIVARTAVIPSAVAFTLFPAFSFAQGSARVAELFRRPVRILLLLQWPLLVVFWLFPHELIELWMNAEIATAGANALRLLALVFFFNGFAQVALAGVQGLGRPDLKAKLDAVQLPLYLVCAAILIDRFGVTGAAAAKLTFTIADTVVLFIFARRLGAPLMFARERNRGFIAGAMVLAGAGVAAAAAPLAIRTAAAIVLLGALGIVWVRVLDSTDRAAVRGVLARRRFSAAAP